MNMQALIFSTLVASAAFLKPAAASSTPILPIAATQPADNYEKYLATQKPAAHGPEAFKLKQDAVNRIIDDYMPNASPKVATKLKASPIFYCVANEGLLLVESLLKAGASANQTATAPGSIRLPLHLAIAKGAWHFIPLLLKYGADATIMDGMIGVFDNYFMAHDPDVRHIDLLIAAGAKEPKPTTRFWDPKTRELILERFQAYKQKQQKH